jgi:hypothetical protein
VAGRANRRGPLAEREGGTRAGEAVADAREEPLTGGAHRAERGSRRVTERGGADKMGLAASERREGEWA